MKNLIYVSLFGLLALAGCNKDKLTPAIKALPFENANIKMELVTDSAPSNIRYIYFFNAETGIASTYDGKIYKTTNGGDSWSLNYISSTEKNPFYKILFTDANVGYVVGGSNSKGGVILKTTDGGNTWTNIFQEPAVIFKSIATNSLGNLFVISNGTKGQIYKSTDAGANWTMVDNFDVQFQEITFSGNFGFCTASDGKIISSSDDGLTWNLTTTLTAYYATDIKFSNGNGFCIANNQTVYKTTNKGSSWTQTLNHQNGAYVLNPLTSKSCLVFGSGTYSGGDWGTWDCEVIQTKDSGNNWDKIELKGVAPIRYTSFYSSNKGYAVAGRKLIKIIVK